MWNKLLSSLSTKIVHKPVCILSSMHHYLWEEHTVWSLMTKEPCASWAQPCYFLAFLAKTTSVDFPSPALPQTWHRIECETHFPVINVSPTECVLECKLHVNHLSICLFLLPSWFCLLILICAWKSPTEVRWRTSSESCRYAGDVKLRRHFLWQCRLVGKC